MRACVRVCVCVRVCGHAGKSVCVAMQVVWVSRDGVCQLPGKSQAYQGLGFRVSHS